ncbi:HlyD family type I secretion periplasmic adaptor subunit [Rhizobium sp. CFBP 8762]|uniref:HlyD family type I secretion periplasmic adaptor subunit n=1 Tax=Rhizobium sp. CFBP 8762 TaxID=2775279 RepID=UPI00177EBBA3|nr:HlyD family type I secretion periplasmic adaptor subunit [Rhizobium sp. CFBP 8762]MBD8557010.1 HlyD family type I secretion periplasmic adaptor subunit [Rhizobium sp. CFBP 8762]
MRTDEHTTVDRSLRLHMVGGIAGIALLLGGVGGWAAATNLAGAVIANGVFVVDSYVKRVQHPTGGVVGEILITEGQPVKAGDVLMRLDATQTRASLAIVTKRLDELAARQARLEAERDGTGIITFPASLTMRIDNADVDQAVKSETRLFDFRKASLDSKKQQLLERVAQYEKEIVGLKSQEAAYDRGIAVLQSELLGVRDLSDRKLVSIQRANALEREMADLGGDRGEAIARQAQTAGRIAEVQLQILQLEQDLRSEVATELREIQGQVGEYIERKVSAEDQLKRIDIIAPQTGIVHQLAAHTVGGVISPADSIMTIVPGGDDLALEVRIGPQDIEQVRVGQTATLRLSAFNQRETPELFGTVTRVAADLTEDQKTGQSFYLVRITLPPKELQRLGQQSLIPGMPAEAFIRTQERTALSYFTKPLADQIARAFREE